MAVKKVVASLDAPAKTAEKAVEAKKTETKKATPAKKATATKTAAPKAEKKVEAPKAAAPAKKAEAPKAAAPAKKAAAKPAAKKAAPVKAAKAVAEVKIQVADREYTQEDLVKIANDVWVYDFDKKASELKKIQLFVKAEEMKVYYVFNDEFTGDFNI